MAALVRACALALCVRSASALGPAVGVGGVALGGFLGWAFQGVGPSPEARAAMDANPPAAVPALDGLLFGGGAPEVALYCGAKVAPASYAPLAGAVSDELGGAGVLVLQSPFNVYASKPARVEAVLAAYPSVTCVAGHSIGGGIRGVRVHWHAYVGIRTRARARRSSKQTNQNKYRQQLHEAMRGRKSKRVTIGGQGKNRRGPPASRRRARQRTRTRLSLAYSRLCFSDLRPASSSSLTGVVAPRRPRSRPGTTWKATTAATAAVVDTSCGWQAGP